MTGENMPNKTRRLVRDLDQTNEFERGLPCVVRHADAGGRCGRSATIRTHEMLNYCPEYGEEARIGALSWRLTTTQPTSSTDSGTRTPRISTR